jgi:hypothetical protein
MRRVLIVAVVVLVCAAPAAAHTYGGRTADDGRISFRFSAAETHFVQLHAERELACRKGKVRSFRVGAFRQRRVFVRVAPNGAFRGTVRTRGPKGSLVRLGRFTIKGRAVNESFAEGVFRERARLRNGTRCDSGRVRFKIPLISTNE